MIVEAGLDFTRLTGSKRATKPSAAQEVTDSQAIHDIVVKDKAHYVNPAIRNSEAVPAGALRRILTGVDGPASDSSKLLEDLVGEELKLFFDYFVAVSQTIIMRERRRSRRKDDGNVYQIDTVKISR